MGEFLVYVEFMCDLTPTTHSQLDVWSYLGSSLWENWPTLSMTSYSSGALPSIVLIVGVILRLWFQICLELRLRIESVVVIIATNPMFTVS